MRRYSSSRSSASASLVARRLRPARCSSSTARSCFLGLDRRGSRWMVLLHAVLAPSRPCAPLARRRAGSCTRSDARRPRGAAGLGIVPRGAGSRRAAGDARDARGARLTAEAAGARGRRRRSSRGQPLLVVNVVEVEPRAMLRSCSATIRSCRRTSRSRCARRPSSPTRSASRSNGCGSARPRPVDALLELVAERAPGLLVVGPDPARIRARALPQGDAADPRARPAASSGCRRTEPRLAGDASRARGDERRLRPRAAAPSAARRAPARRTRRAGPWTPRIAASSPRLPRTGAAIAARSSSRSPTASRPAVRAHPLDLPRELRAGRRSCAPCSAQRAGRQRDVAEGEHHLPGRRSRAATLGRPICATLCTDEGLRTKSTVTASCSPGDRERRRLARRRDEPRRCGPRELAEVEPVERRRCRAATRRRPSR